MFKNKYTNIICPSLSYSYISHDISTENSINENNKDETIIKSNQFILITGGLGFIGSHVVVQLLNKNYNVVIIDNLSNSNINVFNNIVTITNRLEYLHFIKCDIRNEIELCNVFKNYKIECVMHFAALKSVSESEKYPELYHDVNIIGTKTLLEVMKKYDCTNFIYSSSATVYGDSKSPVTETTTVGNNLTCNYARNKFDMEQYLLNNHVNGDFKDWNITILRYFNPIGADPSGLIGEDPNGVPNNIFPYLLRVAKWTNDDPLTRDQNSPYKEFTIYGNDYNTRDGTCIRDYVHVHDLARAHIMTLSNLNKLNIYNVGTGVGTTVLELVYALNIALESKNMRPINFKVGPKRIGDLDICYANVDKIHNELGFKTQYDITKMCIDGLNFVKL